MADRPTLATLAEKVEALERRIAELEADRERREVGRRLDKAMHALPAPPVPDR